MKHDDETTLQELKELVIQFSQERGWRKHHTPRNLATSIIVEAAELLEHFQWGDYSETSKQAVADELSDVLTYCFNLAATLDIDISTAYRDKLERAKKKFPTEKFNAAQDNTEEYHRIRRAYRTDGEPTEAS